MNPKTGAVLACASSPTYDINDVDDILAQAASGADATNGALINRATSAVYAPGSTFKLVTLTALIEGNLATPSTTVDAPAQMTIGNASVTTRRHWLWHHHARPGSRRFVEYSIRPVR